MTQHDTEFDDYLGLMDRNLSSAKLLVFHGCSGSGKSSYLAKLQEHQSFAGHDHRWFFSDPDKSAPETRPKGSGAQMALIDEVTKPRELRDVFKLLRRFDVVAIATHVHPAWFALLRARWSSKVFSTQENPEKIERYLNKLGLRVRTEDVEAMCARYGASYAIADIVREHHSSQVFAESWAHFLKFATIKTQRNPAHKDWRLRVT